MPIEFCRLIPMRDEISLAADIYTPNSLENKGPWPGIVFRTPYGRSNNDYSTYCNEGYCVISVDARGTGASAGNYDYYNMDEGRHDGYDLVEWLAEQDFCDGNVAAVGASAQAIYATCAGADQPPHLRCMLLDVIPLDFYEHQWYPGGILRQENRQGWCIRTAMRAAADAVWTGVERNGITNPHQADLYAKRHNEMNHGMLSWAQPYFQTRERTEVWNSIDLRPRFDTCEVPIYFGGVLFDHFGKGSHAAYRHYHGKKKFTMHSGTIGRNPKTEGWGVVWQERIAWLDSHLKEGSATAVYGDERWHFTGSESMRVFPAKPKTKTLHLSFAEHFSYAADKNANTLIEYNIVHNPEKPALTALTRNPKAAFDPVIEHEAYHVLDCDFLQETDTIIGHPRLHLRLRCSDQCGQITARFCIREANGQTRMLNYGAQKIFLSADQSKLEPHNNNWRDCVLEFWTIAHDLQKGETLRIAFCGSESPYFENPGKEFTVEIDPSESYLAVELLEEA